MNTENRINIKKRMGIKTITPESAQKKLAQGAVLVDIREADEYRREHIEHSLLQPLAQITQQGLPERAKHASCIIFHCKSGIRTRNAAELLDGCCGGKEMFILEKGLEGWKSARFPTQADRSQPLEMMRQVQIAAGALILAGFLLGWLVSPAFYLLCAFVGLGLLTAGITGFCGMARLLAVMPWNRQ